MRLGTVGEIPIHRVLLPLFICREVWPFLETVLMVSRNPAVLAYFSSTAAVLESGSWTQALSPRPMPLNIVQARKC